MSANRDALLLGGIRPAVFRGQRRVDLQFDLTGTSSDPAFIAGAPWAAPLGAPQSAIKCTRARLRYKNSNQIGPGDLPKCASPRDGSCRNRDFVIESKQPVGLSPVPTHTKPDTPRAHRLRMIRHARGIATPRRSLRTERLQFNLSLDRSRVCCL